MSKRYTIPSSFQSLPIEVFVYQAKKREQGVVFILKGLYSMHDPDRDSWERELMGARNDTYTFVCINTARLSVGENTSKEVFLGKTFAEECADIEDAVSFLLKEKILSDAIPHFAIAHSFGGTTLLGTPWVLANMSGITLIASGCGKSPTTEKPLLQTLYDTENLLEPLRTYRGVFVFIRGTNDAVVPKASQDVIIFAAVHTRARIVVDVLEAEHNLTHGVIPRNTALVSAFDMMVAFKR